ncbi:MAG TPA: SCO family protein [Methylomirabilota bacterium]|nr:SCO family protein [Methylomirabilota bacterium]
MNSTSRRVRWIVWGGLFATMAVVGVLFVRSELDRRALRRLYPVLFHVGGFSLTNQIGRPVTLNHLRGQVWIANIIFTRCAGPCPTLTRQMSRLQEVLPPDAPIRLVTLTADPEHDTPAVLADYARRAGADPTRWAFLTGPRSEIARVAVEGLKLVAVEKDEAARENPSDLFIHSTLFVLVDRQGRLRGFAGPDFTEIRGGVESEDPEAIAKLAQAAAALARER